MVAEVAIDWLKGHDAPHSGTQESDQQARDGQYILDEDTFPDNYLPAIRNWATSVIHRYVLIDSLCMLDDFSIPLQSSLNAKVSYIVGCDPLLWLLQARYYILMKCLFYIWAVYATRERLHET
jgi:hypothetical protein